MTDDLEDRVRQLETDAAVNKAIVDRVERDLSSIAGSLESIKQVVTKWRGGLGVIILGLGGISLLTEVIIRKLFP
jgi:hypothetical protein